MDEELKKIAVTYAYQHSQDEHGYGLFYQQPKVVEIEIIKAQELLVNEWVKRLEPFIAKRIEATLSHETG